MERDTQPLSVGNHTFAVKTYATAREANAIQQALFKGTKVELVGEKPNIAEFNTGAQFEQQQELIRQMVVSMDQVSENIVERCLDLPNEEFDELVVALDVIVAKKKS